MKHKKFNAKTHLNTSISVTEEYWNYITTVKHPYMLNKENDVVKTLEDPDIIRQSKIDKAVYLFYRQTIYGGKQYYMCAVANSTKGFVITAYITDRIKEGREIWKR